MLFRSGLGIHYHVGVDGVAVTLMLLTGFLAPLVVLGHKASAQFFPDTPSPLGRHLLIGNAPFEVIGVPAVPGETMQQILARFDSSVAANKPDEIWLFAGQNNLLDADGGVGFIAALREYVARAREIGAVVRVFDTTPRHGAFHSTNVQRNVIVFQRAIADMKKEGLILSSSAGRAITDRTSATGSSPCSSTSAN